MCKDPALRSKCTVVTRLCQGVGLALYRIFFHPLAKYPGPWAAKVSDVYMLYYAWKGDRHLEFWRLHERYGKWVLKKTQLPTADGQVRLSGLAPITSRSTAVLH